MHPAALTIDISIALDLGCGPYVHLDPTTSAGVSGWGSYQRMGPESDCGHHLGGCVSVYGSSPK